MISAPLAPDLANPAGPWAPPGIRRSPARTLAMGGIAFVAVGVVSLAAWVIFVSPFGFTRYPMSDLDRTFNIHRAGTYVVYLEAPGESRAALPPALDVNVVPLSGQHVDVRPIGTAGVVDAPHAYDLDHHEGRAIAVITARQAGAFVVSISPTDRSNVDTTQRRVVTGGTIALGREWSRSWLASWFGFVVVVILPVLVGVGLMVAAGLRRGEVRVDR